MSRDILVNQERDYKQKMRNQQNDIQQNNSTPSRNWIENKKVIRIYYYYLLHLSIK